MDLNFKRRAREHQIATEVASELYDALRPAIDAAGPSADGFKLMRDNNWLLADIFGRACARHQFDEAAAKRVYSYIPGAVAAFTRRLERINVRLESNLKKLGA